MLASKRSRLLVVVLAITCPQPKSPMKPALILWKAEGLMTSQIFEIYGSGRDGHGRAGVGGDKMPRLIQKREGQNRTDDSNPSFSYPAIDKCGGLGAVGYQGKRNGRLDSGRGGDRQEKAELKTREKLLRNPQKYYRLRLAWELEGRHAGRSQLLRGKHLVACFLGTGPSGSESPEARANVRGNGCSQCIFFGTFLGLERQLRSGLVGENWGEQGLLCAT